MARTAKKRISVKDEGIEISKDVDSFDYVGEGVDAFGDPNIEVNVAGTITETTTTTDSLIISIGTDGASIIQKITGLSEAMTINAPTGTPTDRQLLQIDIKDNGTTRPLTWNAIFTEPYIDKLPTNTITGKQHKTLFQYNIDNSKWELLSHQEEE